jgi:hypothetical protein
MVYGENCFEFDMGGEKMAMVTSIGSGKNTQYFNYYADGRKEGPFSESDSRIWTECGEDQDPCGKYEPESDESPDTYVKREADGYYVNFNGQRYGPYQIITNFVIAPDQTNFYACGIAQDMKASFFDGTGRKVQVTGVVEEILMSPDGKKAILKTSGDYNLYDPAEMAKLMEHPEELSNPKAYYYDISGERKGPFDPSEFREIWFTLNNHLVYKLGDDFFVDGKLLFSTPDYYNSCDLYISDKIDKYIVYTYENIHFSDGFEAPFPVTIQVFAAGDLMVVKWITLEDEKNLVLYQRTF